MDDRPGPGEATPRIVLRGQDLSARRLDDETIVLDLRRSSYLATNPTGTVLWQRLQEGTTRDELIAALLDEFDVTADLAARDVDAFLAECRQRDLLAE